MVGANDEYTAISALQDPYSEWLTFTSGSSSPTIDISVYSESPSVYTNQDTTYYLLIELTDYIAAYPDMDGFARYREYFTVNLRNCIVNSLNVGTVHSETIYNIYTPVQWQVMDEFTMEVDTATLKDGDTDCGYPIEYTAYW